MNILITSAGRRVSLVRAFKKELKIYFPESKVFASDATPHLSAACHVADDFFEVPMLEDDSYFKEIVSKCELNNIKLIVPTIDTELLRLSENRDKLSARGIRVVISSSEFISKCRDKRAIHKFFKESGVRIAEEYDKNNYKLPMFVKPSDGSRSVGAQLINETSELTDIHFEDKRFMFLEYINHEHYTEFTCDLYYTKNNKLKCVVPRKRLEVRDGEVYKALTQNNALVPYIKKHLNYIEGAVGCITVQFFLHNEDESKICAIEINPRFGGGFPLSYLAGANFPKWLIEEHLLGKIIDDKFESWESNLLMIRYDDEILVHGYQD